MAKRNKGRPLGKSQNKCELLLLNPCFYLPKDGNTVVAVSISARFSGNKKSPHLNTKISAFRIQLNSDVSSGITLQALTREGKRHEEFAFYKVTESILITL